MKILEIPDWLQAIALIFFCAWPALLYPLIIEGWHAMGWSFQSYYVVAMIYCGVTYHGISYISGEYN